MCQATIFGLGIGGGGRGGDPAVIIIPWPKEDRGWGKGSRTGAGERGVGKGPCTIHVASRVCIYS